MSDKFLHSKAVLAFKHPDKEAILRYIPLIYSVDSPFNKIEDLAERKKVAASKCEIEVPNNADESFRKVAIEYLRQQNHNKFSLLITKQQVYEETLEVLGEPLTHTKDDDKRLKNIKLKGDVNDLCEKLVVEIARLQQDIFTKEYQEEAMKVISPEERLRK